MNSSKKSVLIILGNQLFPNERIASINPDFIFMAEDFGLCTYERHHKLKILMFFAAMREKRDELMRDNFNINYLDLNHPDFSHPYEIKLKKFILENSIQELKVFEIEDKSFEERIKIFSKKHQLKLSIYNSPMFLISRDEFLIFNKSKNLRMGNFYKEVRKKLNILIDTNNKPTGGRWTFDDENRKKIPKGMKIPKIFKAKSSIYIDQLRNEIIKIFPKHPGSIENVWFPITREEALKSIDYFLDAKFYNFGTYEDAILKEDNFLFHSAISPSLNLGIITPQDITEKTINFLKQKEISLNNVEGFLRQIIGWREFIRGVYQSHSEKQINSNYFQFNKSLKDSWYNGTTGIPPLDDAIQFSEKYGFTHHINRLMIISNLMTLSEIHPKNIYHWFMEMYIDSSEWVMTPNVMGMGTFADGGIFSTKPYICSSNYILKMSNYKKGEWCNIVDGLYWRFVENHFYLLKYNPRLSFLRKTLNNMSPDRKKIILDKAEEFISKNTF